MLQFPTIDPVAIRLGPLAIHWYGLMYLVAFGSAWLLGRWRISHHKTDLTARDLEDIVFYGILAVVLGGRLGYALFSAGAAQFLGGSWREMLGAFPVGFTVGAALALARGRRERELLSGISELGHRIDTSDLQPKALRHWIKDLLGLHSGSMMLLFESFGFKEGIPLDANWVIDARMLPNPYYEPRLRALTGRDAPVVEFLEGQDAVGRLYEDVRSFLSRWLPDMARDNRYHVTVAIGCTGGQHRSVYLAEKLAAEFGKTWPVLVRHRGLANKEPSD